MNATLCGIGNFDGMSGATRERGMENVYNELAESVLTAPIEDLEEEIRAEGRDPDKVAEEVRQIMRDACAKLDDHT